MGQSPQKIGLLEHLGGSNLGDEATLAAVVQNIRSRWPNTQIYGFSMNPSDTLSRHGISSYPIRVQTWASGNQAATERATIRNTIKTVIMQYGVIYKFIKAIIYVSFRLPRILFQELIFLAKSFKIVQSIDLLIISGGGQLLDFWGGPWKFPYTIFKWVLLAKLARVKCIVLNVGAGPIDRKISKYFIRKALFLANYASFRDKQSLAVVRDIGFTGEAHVFPDCVYGLDIATTTTSSRGRDNPSVVGIAPMAYGDPHVYPEHDPKIYEQLIRNLDSFGSWLIGNEYRLSLFCSDINVDPPAIEDLAALLRASNKSYDSDSIVTRPINSGTDLLRAMGSMDYVITCRFHGVVFAHMLNIPVLAISHHPKMVSLMENLGLSEYCVDIQNCDAQMLAERFNAMTRNAPAIKERMAAKVSEYKRELSMQFDELFPTNMM